MTISLKSEAYEKVKHSNKVYCKLVRDKVSYRENTHWLWKYSQKHDTFIFS